MTICRRTRTPAAVAGAVLTGVVVAVSGTLLAGPAAAAPAVLPPASSKAYGSVIDAAPGWERENTCSPTEKPGPKALRRLLLTTYAGAPSGPIASNISRACSASDSGHEEGRALDWMTDVRNPAQREIAESFLGWLQAPDAFGNGAAMARRLGISYVVWNNMTWRTADPARGWVEYNGCLAPRKAKSKFANTCHRTHVHLSFTWDGARKRTSYYTGFVACPAPVSVAVPPAVPVTLPVTAPPAVPVAAAALVALPPAPLLGTRTGLGTPTGPCRVHPDVALDLPVLGRGGVPAKGVAAVVLRVRVLRPDVPAILRVWQTGGLVPAESMPADVTGRFADVQVAVGTPGTAAAGLVSLALGGGMGHLQASVVGYLPTG